MLLWVGMENMFHQEFLEFLEENWLLVLILMAWTFIWKGIALWKAAQLSHKYWFVILLVTNTLALLDIIYIYFVANRYSVTVIEDKKPDKKQK
jgi:hypothetical protein